MYKNKTLCLTLGFVLSFFSGCVDADAEAEKALQDLATKIVQKMTIEEKVGQLSHVGISGKYMRSGIDEEIGRYHPGGVILFGPNFGSEQEIKDLNRKLQESSLGHTGIPLLISTDQEGGRVIRIQQTTQFPGAMAMGQAGEPELARAVGFATALELKGFGINLVLAPVLDINNNPGNPVINTRSYGSNAKTVSAMGLAYMEGVQTAGSIPVIKHFPGHGDTTVDSHLNLPRITKSLDELKKNELIPFQEAIEKNAPALMTAHILFPALDPDYPATLSPRIVQELLRKQLGFNGLIFTDAMEMKAIADQYDSGPSAVMAIKAGVDVILLTAEGPNTRKMFQAILESVQKGDISEARINESVQRQIYWKLRTGVFAAHPSQKYAFANQDEKLNKYLQAQTSILNQEKASLQSRYNGKLNQEVSRKSIVSLRKSFDGLNGQQVKKAFLFYRTAAARQQGLDLGIPQDHLIFYRAGHTWLFRIYDAKWAGPWLIELEEADLPLWNLLVDRWKSRRSEPLLGLYSGNPFHDIHIPENGAFLCSFSPTLESRKALVYRTANGPITQADLVLPAP